MNTLLHNGTSNPFVAAAFDSEMWLMTREDKDKVKNFLEKKMMTGHRIERMKGARMKTRTRV